MRKKSIRKHYKNQISYFGKEFSKINKYNLSEWQKSYVKRIKKYLLEKIYKEKTLIDIGTGSGYVAVEMAKIGLNVIACDLTPESLYNIGKFKKKFNLKNIKLITCKAENIPIKDDSVDYIVANAILEHIPNEKRAINEWKRILKNNGKIFLTVPISNRYVFPIFLPFVYFHDKRIGHLRRYTINSVKEKFRIEVLKEIYTGHLIKAFGFIFSLIVKNDKFNKYIEKIDFKMEDKKNWSQNMIVVMKNEK